MEFLAPAAVAWLDFQKAVLDDTWGTTHMTAQERLARQWQMLAAISQTRQGLSLLELKATTRASRATVHRYLRLLIEAGLPLQLEAGRYRLLTERELPPAGFNALQISALHLARMQLSSLQGTPLVLELDRLLSRLKAPSQQAFRFAPSHKPLPHPDIVKTIERAQRYRRRAAIEYRAASRGGLPATVHIEPLLINVAEGEPYVRAYCIERQQERTYKLTRINQATLTETRATYRPKTQPAAAFANSVKAWSGDINRVSIRLDRSVAWLAREYPLPGQVEKNNADGSLTIEATVAGLIEAQRRILAWGSAAEVLAPKELRKTVRDELAIALGRYDGPGPARAKRAPAEKSTPAAKRSLRDRETGVG
jgi:predicted DNA-binding transcriptional regulator YafY